MGRAASLTCSYHGWTFNSEGQLTGVPFFEETYYGEWDVSGMPGLIGPHLWETNQRHFYAYWARLMGMES